MNMAQWSPKREEARRSEAQSRTLKQQVELIARAKKASEMLRKNGWTVEAVEPDAWEVKMPGAASVIVRGLASLERKTIGMS
jgi:hypothetical protein